jgi:hypothetical protein
VVVSRVSEGEEYSGSSELVPKFCSERGTRWLVVMALMPSVEPVVEKAQHELYGGVGELMKRGANWSVGVEERTRTCPGP